MAGTATLGGGIYSASKHGVIGLTRSAALENARRGLRVNAVCPAFTDTPFDEHPKGGTGFGVRSLVALAEGFEPVGD